MTKPKSNPESKPKTLVFVIPHDAVPAKPAYKVWNKSSWSEERPAPEAGVRGSSPMVVGYVKGAELPEGAILVGTASIGKDPPPPPPPPLTSGGVASYRAQVQALIDSGRGYSEEDDD